MAVAISWAVGAPVEWGAAAAAIIILVAVLSRATRIEGAGHRGTAWRVNRVRPWWPLILVFFLLLVAGAYRLGSHDSRALLRTPRAVPGSSVWQSLLGMQTPATTVTWVAPGETKSRRTTGRIIGSADQLLVIFDLEACVLRRLPSGTVAAEVRLNGISGPTTSVASVLPRCPRRR